jgi:hypothetical protein
VNPAIRTAAAVCVLAFLAASCSSTPESSLEDSGPISYQVQTSYSGDDFVVHRLVIYRDEVDTVELGVISPNDGSPNSYVLSVVYTADSWRFMDGSVLIRVGTELLRLLDNRPSQSGGFREPVTERLTVVLTRAQFRSITNGTRVAVEYHPGVIAYIDRRAERAMRRFFDEYADA